MFPFDSESHQSLLRPHKLPHLHKCFLFLSLLVREQKLVRTSLKKIDWHSDDVIVLHVFTGTPKEKQKTQFFSEKNDRIRGETGSISDISDRKKWKLCHSQADLYVLPDGYGVDGFASVVAPVTLFLCSFPPPGWPSWLLQGDSTSGRISSSRLQPSLVVWYAVKSEASGWWQEVLGRS